MGTRKQDGWLALATMANSDGSGNPGAAYGWGRTEEEATADLWRRIREELEEAYKGEEGAEESVQLELGFWEFCYCTPFEK